MKITRRQLKRMVKEQQIRRLEEASGLDWLQGGLDVAGFIPGYGEIADAINALISLGRGNPLEALLSAVSMVPVAGDAVGKGGKVVLKILDPAMDMIKNGDEIALIVKKVGPDKIKKAEAAFKVVKETAAKYGPELKELFTAIKGKDLEALEKITDMKVPDAARGKVVEILGQVGDKLPEAEIQSVFKFLAKLDLGDKLMGTDDYKGAVASDVGDAAVEAGEAGIKAAEKLAAGYIHRQSLGQALFGEQYTNQKLLEYGEQIGMIIKEVSDPDPKGALAAAREMGYNLSIPPFVDSNNIAINDALAGYPGEFTYEDIITAVKASGGAL